MNAAPKHPITARRISPKALKRVARRIIDLANHLVPLRPFTPYQKEFALGVTLSILEGRAEEITALFARQSGKTETLARLEVALAILLPTLAKRIQSLGIFRAGVFIGVFAPVKDQASTSFERMVEVLEGKRAMALMRKAGLAVVESNKSSRKLSNGSFIRIWSASPGSNIESKTLHLAVIEESQDVGYYKVRKSIEPMLTSTAGTLVHIGTANTIRSPFYEAIQRNKQIQRKDPALRRHYEYDWKTIIQFNTRYRAFLNAKVLERGKQWVKSDEFRMAYGLEFLLGRGMFISFERYSELEGLCASIPRGPYHPESGICTLKAPVYAGIDWGKSSDSTVVTVIARFADRFQVVDWLEIVGDDYNSQFETIVAFLKKFPTLRLVLSERNGVGDPMTDRLKSAARSGSIGCPVEGFLASAPSNSDGYKALMADFVSGNLLYFPADDEARKSHEYDAFAGKLTEVVKEWKGSLLKVKAPEGADAESGEKHDDYVSSLMIAYWAASRLTSDDMFDKFFKGEPSADEPNRNVRKTDVSRQSPSGIRLKREFLEIPPRVLHRRPGLSEVRESVPIQSRARGLLQGPACPDGPRQLYVPGHQFNRFIPFQKSSAA